MRVGGAGRDTHRSMTGAKGIGAVVSYEVICQL